MDNAAATLTVVYGKLLGLSEDRPELREALNPALDGLEMAMQIVTGELELSACEDCGLTVEDGECECVIDCSVCGGTGSDTRCKYPGCCNAS